MAGPVHRVIRRLSVAAAFGLVPVAVAMPQLARAQPPAAPVEQAAADASQVSTAFTSNDVGRLMEEVYRNRNASWQRLGTFSLRETSTVEIEMPWTLSGTRYRSEEEYEWRVGEVMVRRPLRHDGVEVGEQERASAEEAWLQQATERRAARDRRLAETERRVDCVLPGTTTDLEPKFIEDFYYFAEFTCAPGRFYLVGWERLNGREVVRIEYHPEVVDNYEGEFPERLFDGLRRSSLVTFWVDAEAKQIVRYTLTSRDLDFLPARWLLRVGDLEATMEMVPVPDGWLPKRMTLSGRGATVVGEFRATIVAEFSGYRERGPRTDSGEEVSQLRSERSSHRP